MQYCWQHPLSMDTKPDFKTLKFKPTEIVFRLRNFATDECYDDAWLHNLLTQAADEIERQHTPVQPEKVEVMEKALQEIIRRSSMLIHQNTGRWDMRIEHDVRSHNVTAGNIKIARTAISNQQ